MANATSLYSQAELAYFRENWGETEFLVHVIGPDDVLLYSDERDSFHPDGEHEGTIPHTLETADQAAAAINKTYAWTQENNPSEFDPYFHATVFHYGRPLAPPQDWSKAAGSLDAESLAYFKDTWGATEWMAYIHGMDECFDRRDEDDAEPFTEETVRKYVADMQVWDREHIAQGLPSAPITVFRFGVPFDLAAVASA